MSSVAMLPMKVLIPLLFVLAVGSVVFLVDYYAGEGDPYLEEHEAGEVTMDVPEISKREADSRTESCFEDHSGVQQRDWCYLNLAKEYRIDACEEIIQKDYEKFCQSIIDATPSACSEIDSSSLEESCLIVMAQLLEDSSLCDETSRKEYCVSQLS
ncbi:MAG: hypothetical protein ACLFTR_00420 [Candidatus Woesearchaeota archaeon]